MLENNEKELRFEMRQDGEVVYANYRLEGKTLYIDYVFAPPALRGSGAAGKVMQLIKDEAEKQGWQIIPICGYAATWLRRHA